MKPLHKILMVSTTFMLAAATGHVMQNPEAFGIAARGNGQPGAVVGGDLGLENITPVANVEQPGKAVLVSGLSIEGEAQLPQLPAMRAPQADPAIAALPADTDPETPGFASDCAAPVLSLGAATQGAVRLDLDAPCAAGATVTIRHEGLALPVTLDATGGWHGLVPALAQEARFEADLPGGKTLAAIEEVNDLGTLNRVVLSWTGPAQLALNAFEYGSGYGGAGHVAPTTPRNADTPLGGWMTGFSGGSEQAHVQVYTAPASLTDVHFDLEAAVDAQSCGQDLQADLRRLIGGKAEAPMALSIAMPDCDDAEGAVMMPLPDLPVSVAAN
ncbi:MAG: hypothetical protein AB7U46_02165 [Paenirhodobacter sp.]|uniref:hypothetical protein n=1 Tax=Paenirhodobacter sp. TaxID=1965326 RepID=UPI003D11B7B9